MDYNQILREFGIEAPIAPCGNGHINDTFCTDLCTDGKRYILQRVNTDIFKNPDELMENIEHVTEFLREKIAAIGGDVERGTLTVVKTTDGKSYVPFEGGVYRVYHYIENTKTIEDDKTYEALYRTGKGFGQFQKLLSDFPVEKLHETIPDFHHTPKRVEALKTAIREDRAGRVAAVQAEIDFALTQAPFANVVVEAMRIGEIPVRVTHNDTKINNILFDQDTGEVVAVIDLDTVMPGSMLYDFGDALRMGGSTGAEDETDLDKVWFDAKAFRSFAKGYLEEMKDDLVPAEIALLPFSAKLLTYECGIRFLTDYLNGDTYFKIHREHHNLERARNQFKLVADITAKEAELNAIVDELK